MIQLYQHIRGRVIELIWEQDIHTMLPWRQRLTNGLRIGYLTLRDLFFDSQISLRAMSLVYTTLLSIVPLLAISLSVLKGFGYDELKPALENFLAPLGERGTQITNTIIQFVEGMNSGILGSLGLALLLYNVVSLMQKIESAFNFTWHVTQERSFARRFSDYLSVVLIGPVLVFSALGLTASLTHSSLYKELDSFGVFHALFSVIGFVLPYLLIILAFTLIYVFVPNTKVKIKSALVGAIVAGIAWETVGWLFASFISNANYTAIYSAFAALFFFMIWLYISWTILLTGASIAFYYQNPEFRSRNRRVFVLSNRMKEKVAVTVMVRVAEAFYQRQPAPNLSSLGQSLNLASESLLPVIDCLIAKGLLTRNDEDPPRFLPGQAPELLLAIDIIRAVRSAEEDDIINFGRLPHYKKVDAFLRQYQDAATASIQSVTLKELVTLLDKMDEQKNNML